MRCGAGQVLLLLVGDSTSTTTGGLGVLASDSETKVVTDTTVRLDFLQSLQIITQLRVNVVGQKLTALAVDNVLLSVEEPVWDLEFGRVLQDGHDSLKLIGVQLTSPLAKIDISLLADNVGISSTNTLDLSESVLNLDLAVNVGVEQSVKINEKGKSLCAN